MKDHDIIERIEKAYSVKSPDVLRSLDFDGVEMAEAVHPKVKHRYVAAAVVYAAACLVLVIALPFFIGGRNDEPTPMEPGADVTANSESVPDEPYTDEPIEEPADYDFGGAEFKFLSFGDKDQHRYMSDAVARIYAEDFYLVPTDRSGEVISSAVAERNRMVEEAYNVNITSETVEDIWDNALKRMYSGQVDFSAILAEGNVSSYYVNGLNTYVADLREIESIDLCQSYWMPETMDSLTVGGKTFLGVGMLTMDAVGHSEMMYFNRGLMDKLDYVYPSEMVDSGTWTFDRMLEMIVGAEEDLDGKDGITFADQIGGLYQNYLTDMIIAYDPLTKDNGDGTYELVPYTARTVEAYEKYKDVIAGLNICTNEIRIDPYIDYGSPIPFYGEHNVWDDCRRTTDGAGLRAAFRNNRALFILGSVDFATELEGMKDTGYGIIPTPVLEIGDSYVAKGDSNANVISIPKATPDLEMSGAVLDYMACLSEEMLLPAYLESTLGTNPVQDQRDYAMFEIIKDSVRYEWMDIYGYGDTYIPGSFESMRQTFFDYRTYDASVGVQNAIDYINLIVERITNGK